MPGVLLDTHTLYWLVSRAKPLTDEALVAIGESQAKGTLFISPITAWELSIAAQKLPHRDPPQLNSTIIEMVSCGSPCDLGEGRTNTANDRDQGCGGARCDRPQRPGRLSPDCDFAPAENSNRHA